MRGTVTVFLVGGVEDGVPVVPVAGDAVKVVDVVEEEAGADVAEFAVGGGGGGPVGACFDWVIRLGAGGGVGFLDPVFLGGVEGGELGLQPVEGLGGVVKVAGDEDSAFVRGVAVDSGEFEEAAAGEEVQGVVRDEVVIEGWVVGEEGTADGVGEGSAGVLALEIVGAEFAQAGKGVVGLGMS